MAKNLGLATKIGSGCLATLVSLVGINAAQALDFNFSWDSSINSTATSPSFPGTGVGTVTGSFSLDGKNAGDTFVSGDLSNISINIFDGQTTFSRTSPQTFISNFVEGAISGDGSSITFSDFGLTWNDGSSRGFVCDNIGCGGVGNKIRFTTDGDTTFYEISYASSGDALASINAVAATPVPFEVNPNLGILILMGLWGTKTIVQSKNNSKSINN